MNRSNPLSLPLATVGLSLLVFPFIEIAISSHPWRPADALWRFGVGGITSGTIFFTVLGMLFLLQAAVVAQNHRYSAAVFVVALVMAIAVAGMLIGFSLDALQVIGASADTMKPGLKRTSASSLARGVIGIAGFVAIAVGARAARKAYRPASPAARPGVIIASQKASG